MPSQYSLISRGMRMHGMIIVGRAGQLQGTSTTVTFANYLNNEVILRKFAAATSGHGQPGTQCDALTSVPFRLVATPPGSLEAICGLTDCCGCTVLQIWASPPPGQRRAGKALTLHCRI